MIKNANTLKEVKDFLSHHTYLKTCKVLQNPSVKDFYYIISEDYGFQVSCSKNSGVLNVRTKTEGIDGRISFYHMEELMALDKELKELRSKKFWDGVQHD